MLETFKIGFNRLACIGASYPVRRIMNAVSSRVHRRLPFAFLSLATCVTLFGQEPAPTRPSLLIRAVTLIDGNGGPRPGVDVLVREGRVASIASASSDAADLALDGRGLFLLPGLTDAHVHLSGMAWAERAAQLNIFDGLRRNN